MTTRRTFLGWLSGIGAALGIGVRARPAGATAGGLTAQAAPLDGNMVRSVADAVLPSELGNDGITRVSRAFTEWIGGYREGVELVHPYGSAQLRQTGASPVGRWRMQLADLERAARNQHARAFTALTREQRRTLVMQSFADDRAPRLPDPLQANHVAMGIMAWFFGSPEANDLCYDAKIGRNQCRPLVHSPRQPLPLKDSGRPS